MKVLRTTIVVTAVLLATACAPTTEHAAAPPGATPAAAPPAPAGLPVAAPRTSGAGQSSGAGSSAGTPQGSAAQASTSGGWIGPRGVVPPPPPPADDAARAPAAVATVEAYLSAAVRMFHTGDTSAFLAVTTPGCGCRALAPTAVRLARAGGIRGFDVRVSSLREVDSAGTVASVVLADYVIPAHTEPATPGHPVVHEAGTRYTVEFYLLFRGGLSKVDRTLRMRTWPA